MRPVAWTANRTRLIGVSGAQGFREDTSLQYRTTVMKHHATPVRRLIAVAAAAIAGLTISSAAYAATSSPAAPAATAIPRCAGALGQDGNVSAWVAVDQGSGTAGATYYPLEFTNTSGHACSLDGYPGVSAISRAGQQLGSPAVWGTMSGARQVVLAPGATAHTMLAYHDVEAYTPRAYDPGAPRSRCASTCRASARPRMPRSALRHARTRESPT
jgi:hypothetical protein